MWQLSAHSTALEYRRDGRTVGDPAGVASRNLSAFITSMFLKLEPQYLGATFLNIQWAYVLNKDYLL